MQHNNTIFTGGSITTKQTKRGIEFHCFNFERQRRLHIGTLRGVVYEKVGSILHKPEASLAVTQSELRAAIEHGAEYLRIIPPDHSATYSISIQDFQANAQEYHNAFYGAQLRVPLRCFQRTGTTAPRNAIRDNPPKANNLPKWGQDRLFAEVK